MKISLAEADRERLGAPGELDCDIEIFTVREAEAVEDATGLAPNEALALMYPIREPVGEDKLRIRLRPKGARLRVWLGLHRAGITVPFDDLDFDFRSLTAHVVVDAPAAEPGKDSAVESPSTPSTSRTTGRRTRPKKSAS